MPISKNPIEMEMLDLTPGEWRVTEGGDGVYALRDEGGENRRFALVQTGGWAAGDPLGQLEVRANARAFAASKDLLAAAILAKEFEQHAGGTHLNPNAWFKLHEALDHAIKKATIG